MTVEQIGHAATEIADRNGLAAVTMAAIARDLGCTKMALYRYVDGKDDLVAVMFDAAMGPPAMPRGGSWQDELRSWATALLARYAAHPWALDVPVGGRVMTRNQTLWLESALRALRECPLWLRDKLSLVLLVNGHVVFSAKLRADAATAQQWAPDPALQAVIAQHDLPEVTKVFAGGYLSDHADDHADFRWGLDCILRGVAAGVGPTAG